MQIYKGKIDSDTFKRGFLSGLEVTWQLAKIVVPIYFIVTFLKYTPLMNFITWIFSPVMGIFGLPGRAAIALVLGNLVNLYAAIGAMVSLSLNAREITILGIMLSFCHSLPVETALAKKIGLSAANVVLVRASLSIIAGILFNLILN